MVPFVVNPYVAILGGGNLRPRRTFYPVAPKLLRIVTKAFVTLPSLNMRGLKMLKKTFRYPHYTISNMAAGKWKLNWKRLENFVKRLFGF